MSDYPWPPEDHIALVHGSPGFERNWSCFDLSGCGHNVMVSVTPLGVNQGDWHVMLCRECGHTTTECLHNKMEWNEAGTLLRCTTCGKDGT